jgi:hypothetical protein
MCLQGSEYNKLVQGGEVAGEFSFGGDKGEQLKKQLEKRRLCWLVRALDRATVVGLMHAKGCEFGVGEKRTKLFDHSDDSIRVGRAGRAGQTLAGPWAYDPAQAHHFLRHFQGMAAEYDDVQPLGDGNTCVGHTSFLRSITTLTCALTTKVSVCCKHQVWH